MPVVCNNYINGVWVKSASGRTYENRNPANPDELVSVHQKSNGEDVDYLDDWYHEYYLKAAA